MMKRKSVACLSWIAFFCLLPLTASCGGGAFDETGLQTLVERLRSKNVEKALLAERRSGMDEKARKAFDDAFVVKVAKEYQNPGQIVTRVLEISDERLVAEARDTLELQALGGVEGICASLPKDLEKVALVQETHMIDHGSYADALENLRFKPAKWSRVTIAPYTTNGYAAYRVSISNTKCTDADGEPKTMIWDSGRGGFTR